MKKIKSNIQLIMVGHIMNNDYKEILDKLINKFDLSSSVKFIPHSNQAMALMPFCDLIILPTYEETFGLVVAEAMIMGVPVIGSNAGGVPEIIEDFSQISTLDPNAILQEQEEEIALMELVEYVRVSVQLFYENLRGQVNES